MSFYVIFPFIIMAISSFLIIRVMFQSNKRLRNASLTPNPLKKNSIEITAAQRKSLLPPMPLNQQSINDIITADTTDPKQRTSESTGQCFAKKTFQLNPPQTSTNSKTVSICKSVIQMANGDSKLVQNIPIHVSNKLCYFKKAKTKNLTYLLITINLLFFILLSPLAIYISVVKKIVKDIEENLDQKITNIAYLMAYSNHAFNFVFYGLTSAPYRNSIIKYLTCKKCKKKLQRSHYTTKQNNNNNINNHNHNHNQNHNQNQKLKTTDKIKTLLQPRTDSIQMVSLNNNKQHFV